MNPGFLAALPVTKPVAIGIGVAGLVGLYLAFKVGKFILKTLLIIGALIIIGLVGWRFYSTHHGML